MPLYRTNSDRGLWKKYRDPQPQHFHKPQYLELEKPKPQVSQSQVQSRRPFPEYGDVDRFEKIKIKKENSCQTAEALNVVISPTTLRKKAV